MAENKLNGNGEINVGKVLQHFNREENPSKERFLDCMFVALTQAYGFNRVAFYEVHPSEKFAEPVLIMGPDSGEEHTRIMPIVAELSLDDLLDEDRSDVKKRTTPALEENFKGYKIPLDAPSRFENSFSSGDSFFGRDKEGYQLTDVDKRIGEIFGTNNYALITVKGTKGKVTGWFYVDYKFSNKSLFDVEGKPVIDKESIRLIVEATSSQLQTIRWYEKTIRYKQLEAMQEGLRRAAHEIRTPLDAIIGGYARSILNRANDPEWVKTGAKVILAQVDRLMTLVNKIRDASRKIESHPSRLDLYEAVQEGIESLTLENKREYLLFKPEIEPIVYADPKHTKAVILNLAENAFQAVDDDPNPNRGTLKVSFSFDSENAYVSFHNQQYIAPDILPHIFEPYFTTKKEGLGLGLDICLRYMQANSGDLTVSSLPDKGATFTMQLPLYKGQDQKQG